MSKRILFATDVPFWHASTGAEQRILSIHRFLLNDGNECGVFFLGELSEPEHSLIENHNINVFENASHRPPEKLLHRVKWYADATVNQARSWLHQRSNNVAVADGPGSLVLEDFEWPWAISKFSEVVDSFEPTVVIVEYIKMAYLLKGLSDSQKRQIATMVDTHDVLHRRAEQFFENGFPHWLRIDRQQESDVLREFDAVIAIQDQETKTFQSMVDQETKVITVGHAVDTDVSDDELIEKNYEPTKRISVGYIGSKNFSNWQAIREFLNCAWPSVLKKYPDSCELVIAGGICDWFDKDESGNPVVSVQEFDSEIPVAHFCEGAFDNVKLLGRIDNIEEFYDQIDLVINPVQFGTGLKIKNAESLRFGKLLITTTNGFDGMPEATRLACMVVDNVNEMGLAINSICNDLSAIRPMQTLALQLSQTEFSESQAYAELKRFIETPKQP